MTTEQAVVRCEQSKPLTLSRYTGRVLLREPEWSKVIHIGDGPSGLCCTRVTVAGLTLGVVEDSLYGVHIGDTGSMVVYRDIILAGLHM